MLSEYNDFFIFNRHQMTKFREFTLNGLVGDIIGIQNLHYGFKLIPHKYFPFI